MSKEDILQRIQDVFRDIFNDDSLNINKETNANDIEDWDSLHHIRLVLSVEKEFKVKLKMHFNDMPSPMVMLTFMLTDDDMKKKAKKDIRFFISEYQNKLFYLKK